MSERTRIDDNIASLAFGWSLAIATLAGYRIVSSWVLARKHTRIYWYFSLCAALVLISATLAVLSWTYLISRFRPGVVEFAVFLLLWSLEVQIYFQIIINRMCILYAYSRRPLFLRFGTFIFILMINALMIAFWLPGKLGMVTSHGSNLVFWMPRIEKILYLVMDIVLNCAFIYQIQIKLMRIGLHKYRRLIRYNMQIIALSLLCDALLLGMQWYPANDGLFIIIHPVSFLNKLILEMSVCDRMAAVSREAIVMEPMPIHTTDSREFLFPEKIPTESIVSDDSCSEDRSLTIAVEPLRGMKQLPGLPLSATLLSPVFFLGRALSKRSQLSYYAVSV
ncbi:protein of unknown function [Taphrina deformans PYCC 5710]|uniref:Integral membrane protein n=1 Tax=Taphrina deformans (strain PYCC 5710 / ATCC 11124 / CBS 356.35 / IMI 108563 / JCM 9778 / NBRC 8474) TaxID=1097556 RepID=R4XC68_TAPDE|nr:protein of unknown function [Taphrina deformans PYCC 5710]|eukprot:CCG83155.1 protein of unknown function [Taphrina deformans PYCC 5710]